MNIEKELCGIMAAAKALNPPTESDYVFDGLLYCGNCHTQKQVKIDIGGVEYTVFCVCQCKQERLEREKHENLIEQLRREGITNTAYLKMRFENDDGKREQAKLKACENYVNRWRDAKKHNLGLLLWGDKGTGKTFAAAAIVNALIDKGIPCLLISFPELLERASERWAGRAEYFESLGRFQLLCIDDFGAERSTEYTAESVYGVINERYKQQLPMVVTTNIPLTQLQKPQNAEMGRVYDRVLEMCVPIQFAGESRRKGIADDKLKLARELLHGA